MLSTATSRFITRNAQTHEVLFGGDIERWWRRWRLMFRGLDTVLFAWPTKSKGFATKWWRWVEKDNGLPLLRPALAVEVRVQGRNARPAICGIYSVSKTIRSRC